jgi:hypothetical protein
MPEIKEVWSVAGAVIFALGGGGVVVFAFSSWLGKVWATRIAKAEKARFTRDLETYKAQLGQLAADRADALTRKRDIYGRLVTSMRVFSAKPGSASPEAQREFNAAYDQASLWASEEVAHAVGQLVDLLVRNSASSGAVSNDALKDAYRECVGAMRRDSGFPDTAYSYRVVTFS